MEVKNALSLSVSRSLLSDTTKDFPRSPNCRGAPSRLRTPLSSCVFNLLGRTKWRAGWRHLQSRKKWEPEPPCPWRLRPSRGRNRRSHFLNFPSGLDERSVTLAYFCIRLLAPFPPLEKRGFENQTREDQTRFHSLWLSSVVSDRLLNRLHFASAHWGLFSQYHIHELVKSMQTSFGWTWALEVEAWLWAIEMHQARGDTPHISFPIITATFEHARAHLRPCRIVPLEDACAGSVSSRFWRRRQEVVLHVASTAEHSHVYEMTQRKQ